jgi:Ca2+/H+ antiporter
MVGLGSKLSVISFMNPLILLIGWIMSKLLALIARAKLILLTEEIRQGLKK